MRPATSSWVPEPSTSLKVTPAKGSFFVPSMYLWMVKVCLGSFSKVRSFPVPVPVLPPGVVPGLATVPEFPALLLVMVMLFSLTLTGCGKKEEIAAPDQVAVALYEMILKDDASKAVELFGYADEAAARKDMGLDGSIYDELADELVTQFTASGMTVSTEQMQEFVDAFMKMFSEVNLTAKVKEADEKAGTAVITCTVNTFDPEALTQAMTDAMTNLDPSILQGGDMNAAMGAVLQAASGAISEIKPTDKTADFDVDFELADMDVNGKTKKVWVPKDAAEFGNLLSTTAMGG